MAYNDDERRRTASLRLTPQQEDWMARAMKAQAEGLPIPPKPTEMGDDGMQRLTPAYTDPRSQAIAQTPAMIRPAHSMLDKLFRPGRADAANQMNREYKENALTGQIANQSSGADAALKELELRAKSGKDPDALAALEKYYKVEALRRGGGNGFNMQDLMQGNKTVDGLVPAPKSGGGGDPSPLTPALSGKLTLSEAREKATSNIAELQRKLEMLDAEEININTEGSTRSIPSYSTFGSHPGAAPQPSGTRDIAVDMDRRALRTKEIPAERTAMQQEIQKLEQVLSEISGPLTGAGMGGPTEYNPNR